MEILSALFVIGLITLIGHGIWLLLAKIYRAIFSEPEAERAAGDERSAAQPPHKRHCTVFQLALPVNVVATDISVIVGSFLLLLATIYSLSLIGFSVGFDVWPMGEDRGWLAIMAIVQRHQARAGVLADERSQSRLALVVHRFPPDHPGLGQRAAVRSLFHEPAVRHLSVPLPARRQRERRQVVCARGRSVHRGVHGQRLHRQHLLEFCGSPLRHPALHLGLHEVQRQRLSCLRMVVSGAVSLVPGDFVLHDPERRRAGDRLSGVLGADARVADLLSHPVQRIRKAVGDALPFAGILLVFLAVWRMGRRGPKCRGTIRSTSRCGRLSLPRSLGSGTPTFRCSHPGDAETLASPVGAVVFVVFAALIAGDALRSYWRARARCRGAGYFTARPVRRHRRRFMHRRADCSARGLLVGLGARYALAHDPPAMGTAYATTVLFALYAGVLAARPSAIARPKVLWVVLLALASAYFARGQSRAQPRTDAPFGDGARALQEHPWRRSCRANPTSSTSSSGWSPTLRGCRWMPSASSTQTRGSKTEG